MSRFGGLTVGADAKWTQAADFPWPSAMPCIRCWVRDGSPCEWVSPKSAPGSKTNRRQHACEFEQGRSQSCSATSPIEIHPSRSLVAV